jgi:hypothetical protein
VTAREALENADAAAPGKGVDRVWFERAVGFEVAENEVLRIGSASEGIPLCFLTAL